MPNEQLTDDQQAALGGLRQEFVRITSAEASLRRRSPRRSFVLLRVPIALGLCVLVAYIVASSDGTGYDASAAIRNAPSVIRQERTFTFRTELVVRRGTAAAQRHVERGVVDYAQGLLALGFGERQFTRIAIGRTLYVQVGGGRPSWVKAPLRRSIVDRPLDEADAIALVSPQSAIAVLGRFRGEVVNAGAVDDGSQRLLIRLSAVDAAKLIGLTDVDVPGRILIEAWFDRAGRPKRVIRTITTPTGTVRANTTFAGYGAPVRITAPVDAEPVGLVAKVSDPVVDAAAAALLNRQPAIRACAVPSDGGC